MIHAYIATSKWDGNSIHRYNPITVGRKHEIPSDARRPLCWVIIKLNQVGNFIGG